MRNTTAEQPAGVRRLILARKLMNGMGISRRKVFAIGFNKTGTTSIHSVFESLGLPSYHGEAWRDGSNRRLYRLHDCFSDGIPTDFRALDQRYPNARFILNVRDLGPWLVSRLAHIERHGGTPGSAWTISVDSICAWITDRNRHHLAVLSHFADRPDTLLVVNFPRDGDAAASIARFLGHPEPVASKPRQNVAPTKDVKTEYRDMIDEAMARLGASDEHWHHDLLCPTHADAEQASRFPPDSQMLAQARQ